ncbi:putative glutathione transferase transcription factor MYB family [Helianthus annuus]|uniref:Glutathione transferase transcription factor MYB family n=1 Tax=Helianthus annuus TaxID=4232 RepID=A0A9K3DFZ1_HELAN|nr:putative glutathione transferase transcription factor MYB family [Helianthus annuus]
MIGSGSKSRAKDKRGSGGTSVPFHPHLGFANQTQPPFYYNQPMHQPFGYDTQPTQNWMQHGPTMTRPGYYEYSLEAQNAFDSFSFQTPMSQSPRDVQHDSDEEFVQETQEQELDDDDEDVAVEENPVNENVAEPERKAKAKRETWTPRQEEALAKGFVHCTLNKKKGNQQKADGFWKKVLNHYNETVGGSNRTHHQVRSKWMTMQTKINTFNGLYHQADRLRPSGSDDAYVMKQALKDYKSKEKIEFAHVAAWEVVRTNQKWSPVPLLNEESSGSGLKRKSSDSGNYTRGSPNVEISSGFGFDIPDINEDPSPPPLRRQTRKEKKDKGPSSRNEDPRDITHKFEEYKVMKKEIMEIKRIREEKYLTLADEQREALRQTMFDKDLETYNRPTDNIHPAMLEITLARKCEIAKKYG